MTIEQIRKATGGVVVARRRPSPSRLRVQIKLPDGRLRWYEVTG